MVPAAEAQAAARQIEQLGYTSLWFGEGPVSREALTNAGLMLAATERLVIATGIANIYARDATSINSAANGLAEAYPGRFLLGIGVSHRVNVEPRGHGYGRPLTAMRDYLDGIEAAGYEAAAPTESPPLVLAALRERMLRLAAERSAGAHSYLVPVAHTEKARAAIGPEPLLIPEQAVLLDSVATTARAQARSHMEWYLGQTNYVENLLDLGYPAEELAAGGSDRLVDEIVAWGDLDALAARIQGHLEAGADHVVVQALAADLDSSLATLRQLSISSKLI